MAKKYEELADSIVDLIGGKDNIVFFSHCVTRLRFNLKDKSKVQEEKLEKVEGVISLRWQGEQLQVVIGAAVADAYSLICEKNGLEQMSEVPEENTESKPKAGKGSVVNNIIQTIAGSISPVIPILVACGMIKVIVALGGLTGLLTEDMSTYQILTFVGDAGFYFLPIFVGGYAAKRMGTSIPLGMLMGAILCHPTFISLATNAAADGTTLKIYGLPIAARTYTGTIFPVLLSVLVLKYVEKFFKKIIPEILRTMLVPLLTALVMLPIVLCVLAPAGYYVGLVISDVLIWIYDMVGFLGIAIVSALIPFLIMTGMHTAISPFVVQSIATYGKESFLNPATFVSNMDQGFASLAVAIKTKDKNLRSIALSGAVTAILGGVTEPAMYGVNLKYKRPMIAAMIGNFCGAGVAGLLHVSAYSFGAIGIFSLSMYVHDGDMNLLYMIIGLAVGAIVTMICTFILYKDETEEVAANE
ncbi:MAG: PTS transporter subunit EIIC [Lachnospiraceae bacterium]|nr:PTS transporter subunit EIIC [Lachnospiraceae bacterium]